MNQCEWCDESLERKHFVDIKNTVLCYPCSRVIVDSLESGPHHHLWEDAVIVARDDWQYFLREITLRQE